MSIAHQVLPNTPREEGSYGPCVVELASGDIFYFGAFGYGPYIYNIATGQWTDKNPTRTVENPQGARKRHHPECGVIKNAATGKEEVIVAGGSCEARIKLGKAKVPRWQILQRQQSQKARAMPIFVH